MKYSCYYITPFGCLMGFIIHFYIIFGTNLLTQGPVQIVVFCLFQCFAEKEYQTEWNLRESYFWNKCDPGDLEWTSRKQRGRHEVGRCAPHPRGPLVAPPTYFLRLYILLYPKNIQESHETTFPLPQPSISVRSHLGTFFDDLPEGDSITEGFYLNTIASPMMCG